MTRCEFLIYERSKSCSGCTGWFCVAKGRKKKVGDTTICNNDELWGECTRYLQVYPKPPEPEPIIDVIEEHILDDDDVTWTPTDEDTPEPIYSIAPSINFLAPIEEPEPEPPKPESTRTLCPYVGSPPPGVQTCCGLYCYADNTVLRTGSQCKSYPTWRECVRRMRAVKRGIPYAGS